MKAYINIIGIDGSGKDTIFNKVTGNYPNAVFTREPGGTKEAEIIRDIILNDSITTQERLERIAILSSMNINKLTLDLLNKAYEIVKLQGISNAEPFLYAASRSESIEKVVRPALNNNIPVLGCRSVSCSVAYQGNARGYGIEKVWELNYPIVKGTYPTLEIYLDLPVSEAIERLSKRTEKQDRLDKENIDFFKKVREGYLNFYENFCPYPVRHVDATRSIEEVYE